MNTGKRLLLTSLVGGMLLIAVLCGLLMAVANDGAQAPVDKTKDMPTKVVPAAVNKTKEMPSKVAPAEILPAPTATRRPTSTPAPETNSAADQAYMLDVLTIMDAWGRHGAASSELFDEASDTPALMFKESWRLDLAFAFAMIQIANNDLRELQPPDRFSRVHGKLLETADLLDDATNTMARGIDEMDPDLITLGARYLSMASGKMNDATGELLALE